MRGRTAVFSFSLFKMSAPERMKKAEYAENVGQTGKPERTGKLERTDKGEAGKI